MTLRIDIVTLFPGLVEPALGESMIGRARTRGLVDIRVVNLRDYAEGRHRVTDDSPFGGGGGMILKPEPIFRALDAIDAKRGGATTVVLTSPQGAQFTQAAAERLSGVPHLVLLCGRYEGVDERVRARIAEEISIGDYVVSGGELPAMVVFDAVARLLPGVVGDEQSVAAESFSRGLLDFPHYTRPAEFRGWRVPEVLLSGNHALIESWRQEQSKARTPL